MRARNEVTVLRSDLVHALSAAHDRAGEMLIYRRGGYLALHTSKLTAEIEADGPWETPVAADAATLVRLAAKLPRTARITLVYAAERLHVGPTCLPARNAALELETKRQEAGQLVIPGIAPVTDRERLDAMARAPLRPRRR